MSGANGRRRLEIGRTVRFAGSEPNGDPATFSGVVLEQSRDGSEVGVRVNSYPDLCWLPGARVEIVDEPRAETTEHRFAVVFTLVGDGNHVQAAAEIEDRIAAGVLEDFGAGGKETAASEHGGPVVSRDRFRVSAEPLDEPDHLEQMWARIQAIAHDRELTIRDPAVDGFKGPLDPEDLAYVRSLEAKLELVSDIAQVGRPDEDRRAVVKDEAAADRLIGRATNVVEDWRAGGNIGNAVELLGTLLDEIDRARRTRGPEA